MSGSRLYRAFGLNFRSELDMPHWPPADGPVDVEVRWGKVPEALPGGSQLWDGAFSGRRGACVLSYQAAGRFLIEEGQRVTCALAPAGSVRALGTVLSSVASAALLYQRGQVCLHASGAEKDGRAYLIAGSSGAGKSTLVTALLERGGRLISDDITVVQLRADGGLEAVPSFPAVRLLGDSLERLTLRGSRSEAVEALDEKLRQRFDAHFVDAPVRIARFCRVVTGGEAGPTGEAVTGVQRLLALKRVLFRPAMAGILRDPRELEHALATMAGRGEFRRIVRPETGFHLDALCRLIAD